jgi:hypothetical protein
MEPTTIASNCDVGLETRETEHDGRRRGESKDMDWVRTKGVG